jgi:hypothetical protein
MGNGASQSKGKGDAVFKVVGSLLVAVTVAIIGLISTHYLERRQVNELRIRLYTELMSQREEAESALRKDMFTSIIDTFLKPAKIELEEKVLNLELLAYNFHESLNLKPLFLHIQKLIEQEAKLPDSDPAEIEDCCNRLRKVAREITGKQMLSLKGVGVSFDREILFFDDEGNSQLPVRLDTVTLVLDSIQRHFCIEVFEFDHESGDVEIEVEVWGQGEPYLNDFGVGPFDFPMIDNSRLSHDQRFAVVLNAFDKESAFITLVCFPGRYASLKEKPYYDDIVKRLLPSVIEGE